MDFDDFCRFVCRKNVNMIKTHQGFIVFFAHRKVSQVTEGIFKSTGPAERADPLEDSILEPQAL